MCDKTNIDFAASLQFDAEFGFLGNLKNLGLQGAEAMMFNSVALILDITTFSLVLLSDMKRINEQVATIMSLVAIVFNIALHLCTVKFIYDHYDAICDVFFFVRTPDFFILWDSWISTTARNTVLCLTLFALGSILLLALFKSTLHWYGIILEQSRVASVNATVGFPLRSFAYTPVQQIESDLGNFPKVELLNSATVLFRDTRAKLETVEDNEDSVPIEEMQSFARVLGDMKKHIIDRKSETETMNVAHFMRMSSEEFNSEIYEEMRKVEILQATLLSCTEEFERLIYAFSAAAGHDYQKLRNLLMTIIDEQVESEDSESITEEMDEKDRI